MIQCIRIIFMSLILSILCAGTISAQIIDIETFGTGTYPGPELPAGQTNQIYNPVAQPANLPFPGILEDGEYVLATDSQQGFINWASIGDNTTGTGYMMLLNADDNMAGEFYRRRVTLTANTAFDFLTFAVNVNSQGDFDFCTANEGGLILPNIRLQIEDTGGNILAFTDTGDIPFNSTPVWEEYTLTFSTDATTTEVDVVLFNNSIGGCGNDLAIDDIIFRVAVTMDANDDTITITDTTTQQNDILFVGANDTLDESALPGSELYFIEPPSVLPPELLFDTSTGGISVVAGTPSGTYSFEYRVCETANEFNCDTAIATVTVDLPPAVITTQNDSGSVANASLGNTPVLNVLGNDSIDGVSPPSNFDLSLAPGETLPPGLSFDTSTGEVTVLQGTPTSQLSFDYQLCEAGDPDNCETATVTIDVTNPAPPSICPIGTIEATGSFNAVSATSNTQFQTLSNAGNALDAPLATGQQATDANSGTTFNADVLYELTNDANTLVPAGAEIEVALASFFGNNTTVTILTSLDGNSFTSVATSTNLTQNAQNIIRRDPVTVPSGGARFLLLERPNGGSLRFDGLAFNTLCAPIPDIIVTADDDNGSVADSSLGDTPVLNVLDNDTIDGSSPPANFDLSLASGASLPSGITFDTTTGAVTVLQGTPTGTVSFDYQICESGNALNCETATVTINVTNPNPPSVCPVGTSLTSGTFHAVGVSSNTQFQTLSNAGNALDAPQATGQQATNANSGTTFNADVLYELTDDEDILVPEGTLINVALASFFGNNTTVTILTSLDGNSFTFLDTAVFPGDAIPVPNPTGQNGQNTILRVPVTVPSGGARFLLLERNGSLRFDGVVYDTQCNAAAPPPALPNVSVVKTVAMFDPAQYAIPGNDVVYTITATNSGDGVVDADTLELIDIMPSEIAFFNSATPVTFIDNGSGLTFTLASDLRFSDATGTPPAGFTDCNYTPIANDYDPDVTFICLNPKGSFNAMSSWDVTFRARIE